MKILLRMLLVFCFVFMRKHGIHFMRCCTFERKVCIFVYCKLNRLFGENECRDVQREKFTENTH